MNEYGLYSDYCANDQIKWGTLSDFETKQITRSDRCHDSFEYDGDKISGKKDGTLPDAGAFLDKMYDYYEYTKEDHEIQKNSVIFNIFIFMQVSANV